MCLLTDAQRVVLAFAQRNRSEKKRLVYFGKAQGFGNEINILVHAFVLAMVTGRSLHVGGVNNSLTMPFLAPPRILSAWTNEPRESMALPETEFLTFAGKCAKREPSDAATRAHRRVCAS